MKKIALIGMLLFTGAASARDLTLNDIPAILQKMRGCTETKGVIYGSSMACRLSKSDLSINVESDGELLLMQRRSYGDTLFAHG